MDIFPRSLRENLRRAVRSGDLKREDNLEAVGEQLSDIFQCDSLDLVELVMAIEEQKEKSPTTVGDLMDLIEEMGRMKRPPRSGKSDRT
jgi:acyl carrier protein